MVDEMKWEKWLIITEIGEGVDEENRHHLFSLLSHPSLEFGGDERVLGDEGPPSPSLPSESTLAGPPKLRPHSLPHVSYTILSFLSLFSWTLNNRWEWNEWREMPTNCSKRLYLALLYATIGKMEMRMKKEVKMDSPVYCSGVRVDSDIRGRNRVKELNGEVEGGGGKEEERWA